jgi:hypothetical protein
MLWAQLKAQLHCIAHLCHWPSLAVINGLSPAVHLCTRRSLLQARSDQTSDDGDCRWLGPDVDVAIRSHLLHWNCLLTHRDIHNASTL